MKPKVFLEFIEIYSLIASVFPFVLGILYAYYHYHTFNLLYSILFFIAANVLQMAVNANDNYQDFLNSEDEEEFKSQTNVVGVHNISIPLARTITFTLFGISALIGVYLVTQIGWSLLFIGLVCFAVGYFYAAGPRPISTTPFGEPFSGITMGFFIFFIAAYINCYTKQAINLEFILSVLLSSGIAVFAISNIMLANNICDEQEDKVNDRRTAVYYLGKPTMLKVFAWSYVLGYACLVIAALIGLLPKLTILALLSIPLVWKNVRKFFAVQVKKETFGLSVQNSIMMTLFFTVFMGLGIWLNF